MNKSKPINAQAFDLDLCFLSGVKFFESAAAFFSQVPAGLDDAAKFTAQRRGDLIVASTNLALGVELLLKALAIARAREVLPTHRLVDLFDALPEDYRSSVERLYRTEIADTDPERATAITVLLFPRGRMPDTPEPNKDAMPEPTNIRSVLDTEKDAFRTWRYIHESGSPTGIRRIWCQYHCLMVLCSVLLRHFLLDPQSHRIVKTMCHSGAA